MKDDIFKLYISGVKFVSIVIASAIVYLTSPIWVLIYLGMNTSELLEYMTDKMEGVKENDKEKIERSE